MRRDTATDEPVEELASAIGGISSEPFRLKSQSFIDPLYHGFCRRDLVVASSGGGFHIDDHCVLDVDQVIEPIAELHTLVRLRCPSRAWIHGRDHLWQLAIGVRIFIIERRKKLGNRAGLTLWQGPIDLIRRLAMISAGVGLHDARIDGKAFALNQTSIHAGPRHRLEHMAQEVAVAEAAVPIDRKCRVIWYFVVEIEATKPAVGEMQLYLLAQLPLKANAIAVAHHLTRVRNWTEVQLDFSAHNRDNQNDKFRAGSAA